MPSFDSWVITDTSITHSSVFGIPGEWEFTFSAEGYEDVIVSFTVGLD